MTDEHPAFYRVDVKTFQSIVEVMQETIGTSLRYVPLNPLSIGRVETLLEKLIRLTPEGTR